jgi:hypothetical protein
MKNSIILALEGRPESKFKKLNREKSPKIVLCGNKEENSKVNISFSGI